MIAAALLWVLGVAATPVAATPPPLRCLPGQ